MKKNKVSRHYTDEQRKWIFDNHNTETLEVLLEKFNKKFKQNRSLGSFRGFCWRNNLRSKFHQKPNSGSFKKGQKTWNKGMTGYMGANKTSFKPGQKSHNYKPVGSERSTVDGYIMLKVEDPNIWRLKHRVVWEKAHGAIDKNMLIHFIDGNTKNCSLDNLELVSRREHALMTVYKLQNTTGDLKKAVIRHVKLKSEVLRR